MSRLQQVIEDSKNIVDWRYTHQKVTNMQTINGQLHVELSVNYSLYFTSNNNFRILVNGKTHPLLCGLPSVEAAEAKLKSFKPGAVLVNKEEFTPR